MENNFIISKDRTLPESMDYYFLREKGLQYIESLASKIWTDYNTHDPGITILEVLCYAITELGYRTSFDIKDLLSDANGKIDSDQSFSSAKNIFASRPLNIIDYRKLLTDLTGVQNAFLYPYRDEEFNLIAEPQQEVSFYADCKKDKLVYTKTEHDITLHGLYRVVLDLEENDEYGDLNTGNITWHFPTEELIQYKLQLLFKDWNEIDYEFISNTDAATIANVNVIFADKKWKVTFDLGSGSNKIQFSFEAYVLMKSDVSDIASFIETELNITDNITEIFKLYQQKIRLITGILKEAKKTLHDNRNLCEDFVKLETICSAEIAFCADIEVTPDADIEEVYANVLFQIENYLNPEIKFYLLKEMLEAGIPSDEIFEGPSLKHGFIKNDEIENTKPRTKIYISDIINFIMDTEGVLSVKNVLLTKYDKNGKAELPSRKWCMEIEEGCKAILNVFKSKVLFFKGKLPFNAKIDETLDTLKYIHGIEERNKLKNTADDIEIPKGSYRDPEDFVSIQHEFPQTYAVGSAELRSNATEERRAQSKQLKAYLLFYDQVIANYFSQLANAKNLFSLNKDVKQTYFSQFINDFNSSEDIYVNNADLELILGSPQSGEAPGISKGRETLIESKELFNDRRNRFLDHLIARFAESFNEYVFFLYTYTSTEEYEEIEAGELINDKINFIKDYPVISSERGRAFNYLEESWDTVNVSGFEKRISRLSGINEFSRRFLFCIRNIEIQKNPVTFKYFFNAMDSDGVIILKSLKEYEKFSELYDVVKKIPENVTTTERYKKLKISTGEFSFELTDDGGTALAQSGTVYSDAVSRNKAIKDAIKDFESECPSEGIHLIEHILLRPKFNPPVISGTDPEEVYKLLEVCLGDDCKFCGEEDPYSFRITLVLPYWHKKFMSPEFRNYFETMARTEAPAHCMLKICWVSNTLMNEFETAYKKWLDALKEYESDLTHKVSMKDGLRESSNNMIDILKKLHSEYPEAQLHDCDTGTTNPVLLGSTVLGTYKP
ncbi:MAG: hypothetical protein IPM38_13095 [Ignavibacteria bacterium]|nr:hypothetical protein [Ignavibacteria bacterium]